MGKKARKTRWRTLSIGEGPSDSESQVGDGAKPQGPRGRWGPAGGGSGAHQRYNSSHSTPTRHNNYKQYQSHNGSDAGAKWGAGGRALHANVSTRSSSTASETKITFNEDEYTKITTPRQDVLFKKGYLSKPKPHLQRPLTSAGNSTGDGTPDHQSADGADYPENDFDTVFPYPNGAYDPAMYYINSFDTHPPPQPVLLYDQFGNAALCYPQTPAIAHSTQSYQPNQPNNPREKRYSVDSITESASPNNESNETFPDAEEVFEGAKAFPVEEKKLRKKRRRRKSGEQGAEPLSDEESEEELETEQVKTKYSVDAEEFVPRGFAPGPPVGFVPLVPHEVFPGAFVFVGPPVPPPHFYPAVPPPPELSSDAVEEPEVGPGGPPASIDIAKIVSKLEEAAREQKLLEQEPEVEAEIEVETKREPEVVEAVVPTEEQSGKLKNDKPETETNKTEVPRAVAARYADRLKTHQQPAKKPTPAATAPPLKTQQRHPKSRAVPAPTVTVCPRLERVATATKPPPPPTTTTTTAPTTPDQWISVSAKKKRKSTQKLPEISSPAVAVTLPVEATPPPAPPPAPVSEPEVPEVETVEKTLKNKEKTTRVTNAKNKLKKRIIITDGALQPPAEPPSCSPARDAPGEQVGNRDLEENTKVPNCDTLLPELPEPSTVPETQHTPEITTQEVTKQSQNTEHKKSKKKKNKSNISTPSDPVEVKGSPEVEGAHQDDDMSLELDRMIQRGLYANLEQKLQNFNPGDSFLATLGRSAPAGGPLLYPRPPVLPFPPLILPQSTSQPIDLSVSAATPPRDSPSPSGAPGGPQGLSITQAVREWMDRTREATPEVEIFRKPQELRQEVLEQVLDLDDEAEAEEEPEVVEAAEEADETRSRSRSVDLQWDYEDGALPPVDPAEDALESYESLYGRSGDYQRIQSEALGLRPRPRPRGDGGLPYRAICCTVM